MALFRKFFYRKPPDGLLEISERVYVFDCCFSTDVLEEDEFKVYMGGIVGQLRGHFPDASFMVFNFREGERTSQISDILSEYDMTVMDYPRHYEGCPLLTMEMIHHFLRSSESWLSLGQQNVLLMHCERGGWPVLAFMLAGLLIYRKQYTGEQKTLDMIYKQAPRELLQLLSPLNPIPSQLRYLQYVSRRNVGSEWPPLDRALTLDCVILRMIPNFDGEGGCRPIFRIYGQDPFMSTDRTPKVLFSTPKRSKNVRLYKQSDCDLVKIDIHCHIQGDVVLECISLDEDLDREEMMFTVMFNTAFIRSNILILNRDEIDILWNAKDHFPKDFRAEVLLSEMDAAASVITVDLADGEEKEGLPIEAFAKVQEIFSTIDWLDPKADAALSVIQSITSTNALQEKLESVSIQEEEAKGSTPDAPQDSVKIETDSVQQSVQNNFLEDQKPDSFKSKIKTSITPILEEPLEIDLVKQEIQPQQVVAALQPSSLPKIISQRVPQSSLSNPVSHSNSLQGSPLPMSRYHSAPSILGITDLLQDHMTYGSKEVASSEKRFPHITLPSSIDQSSLSETVKSSLIEPSKSISSLKLPSSPREGHAINVTRPLPSSPSPLAPIQVLTSVDTASATSESQSQKSVHAPISPMPSQTQSPSKQPLLQSVPASPSFSPPPPPPPPQASTSPSLVHSSSQAQSILRQVPSPKSVPTPPPPPPPPPPPLAKKDILPSTVPPPPPPPLVKKISLPSTPPPPPPPPLARKDNVPSNVPSPPPLLTASAMKRTAPPPPPPPLRPASALGSNAAPSAPPPPPSLQSSKGPPYVPPVPPPVPGSNSPLSKATGAASPQSGSSGVAPPPPGVFPGFSTKGRQLSRSASPKIQSTSKRASLKPLHWVKVTRAMQGSLWAEAQKQDEASKAPEFDMTELENLFSATVPNSDQGKTSGKSNRRTSLGAKPDKIHLIDLRRANNCEIMLTKVKIPLSDLMSSLLALDDTVLDVDQVDNLIKFCPTKEEMELLKGFSGDKENLGKCEQFFLELMKVPRVESKLRVFSFKIQFRSQVSDLSNNLNLVNSASEEIRKSAKLKRIMQTILSLGNALNQGTARGSAVGFRLDSLLKLTDTRARNNKMTLMHYLCKVLAEKLPELLDFHKGLLSLEAASKIQLKTLAEEMQAISKGLEKVEQELTASENDGPVSQIFRKMLKDFLVIAEAEVRSLTSLYSCVGRNADALAIYFGEDPARCPFEQVVSTLLNFVKMFVRAHDENCKQLELEKKKAQKEAENEKVKISHPKKETENLLQSPFKSASIK